jgi:DNA-binding LacI/PurR family transcriptional regulator
MPAKQPPQSIVDKKSAGRESGGTQRRLQMADIARLAGVSTATVSRALNGSTLVNEETRTRIAELAKSLNYAINVGAKNLRLGQNRTIAVVIPYDTETRQHLTDPFFLAILGSIADALTERGYDMLLTRVDSERLDLTAEPFETGRALGVILIGQWRHHDQLNELAVRRVPVVVWGAQLDRQLYSTVGSDNKRGGYLATRHLLTIGRRRIAFFGDVALAEVAQRFEGYKQALQEWNIEPAPELIRHAAFLPESGTEAAEMLVGEKVAFDAVFACSDILAMTAIAALRRHGLNVPVDVSVIGYDDIPLAAHFNPPLTTVRQPIDAAGPALVDALQSLIDDGQNRPHLLNTELIVRGTTI